MTNWIRGALLACTSLTVVAQAVAEDFIVAASSAARVPGGELVLGAAGKLIGSLNPGDNFTLLDATDGSIVAHLSLPNQGRYKLAKYKDQVLAKGTPSVRAYLTAMAEAEPASAEALVTDVTAVTATIGDLRDDASRPARVLMVGNALRLDAHDPALSMLGQDGETYIPSGGLLSGPLSHSPYGLSPGSRSLEGAHVHFCALMPEGIGPYKRSMLAQTWAHFVALRAGQLVTFTADVRLCLKRFFEGQETPIAVRPLDSEADPAMLKLSMGRAVSIAEEKLAASTERNAELERALADSGTHLARAKAQLETEASRAKTLSVQLAASERRREKAENSPKVETLAAALADAETEVAELSQALEESEAKRRQVEASVKDIQAAIDDTKTLDGVTTFSRFQEVRHPRHGRRNVTTGVRYQADEFPAYDTSWCYMRARNARGSDVQINLGNKWPGKSPVWSKAHLPTLKDIGLTESELTDYRRSCRFPED